MEPRTLVDLLRERASSRPERLAYAFMADGAQAVGTLTYGELDRKARAIAAQLQSISVAGERALLLYPAGLEFLAAFFGCLYAGIIAVPAPAPEPTRLKRAGPRLRAIVDDAQARLLLSTSAIHSMMDEASNPVFDRGQLRCLETDQADSSLAESWREPRIADSHLAYLQYTSGSTSIPKGVMLNHRNLVFHLAQLQRACGYTADSVTVNWMPYFHDYGLVEGLLEPLHNGTPCWFMSPLAFIKRPFHFLLAISRQRGTHSQAPNFAYDHCVRRVTAEQRAQLDLHSWRQAGNAAEPINPRVMVAFHAAFSPCGFSWRAFCPAYGLAEATLLVSSSPLGQEPAVKRLQAAALENNRCVPATEDGGLVREIAGCGRVFPTTNVAIVRPDTLDRCDPDEVGEIWVADPAVAQGYWQRPEESERTFGARIRPAGEGPFLRTGDLGFLDGRELYVTGRLKDVIIIHGTNHYPQDIEWTVQSAHTSLRPEHGAAFSIMVDGEEKLAIAQEIERDQAKGLEVDAVLEAMRRAVAEAHELEVHAVQLMRSGSIPKTSSGKIQRQACRKAFGTENPDVLATWTAPTRGPRTGIAIRPRAERKAESEPTVLKVTPVKSAATSAEVSRRRGDELIAWLRQYATDRINSRLMDERRSIPPSLILDFGNRGLLGMQVPERYGGLSLRNHDFFRVLEQLAAIDLTLAAVVFLNNTNGIRPIQHFAQPALRDELLPILARGRELAAFGLTEPAAGSNLGGMVSIARPVPGGWRLRGVKRWNASSWAGVVSVFVRLEEADGRLGPVTAFAVRQGSPGLRIGPEALTVGLRGSVQNSLLMNDVPVGPADVLGELGKGMTVAEDALLVGRLCTAVLCIGAMKRCAQLMVRYAGNRSVATGRLLDNPVTLSKLSDLTAMIAANESLVHSAAEMLDMGTHPPQELAMAAKIAASEDLCWAANELIQVLGGRGYMENNVAPQLWRDARVLTIGEGANESLAVFLGRSASDTDTVDRLLIDRFGAPALADGLRDAVRQIKARCLAASAPFSDRSAAMCWAHTLAGRLAADALLLASVQAAAECRNSADLRRAQEWARLRLESTLDRALHGTPTEAVMLSSGGAADLVSGYSKTIGDIEQSLPGEEEQLDPLLQQSPLDSGPGDSPPGSAASKPVRSTDSLDERPNEDQLAQLSQAGKRDLLERMLRHRVNASRNDLPAPTTSERTSSRPGTTPNSRGNRS